MKKLSKYAFLIKHDSYSSQYYHASLKSDKFESVFFGVKNVDDAINVIRDLIKEGFELVELCGGFSEFEELKIKVLTRSIIPVGRAELKPKDVELLQKNLGKK
jgi:hypothetical protein